jgi:hypothetical protein
MCVCVCRLHEGHGEEQLVVKGVLRDGELALQHWAVELIIPNYECLPLLGLRNPHHI